MVTYCSRPLEGDVHAYILNLIYDSKINFKSFGVLFFFFFNEKIKHDYKP